MIDSHGMLALKSMDAPLLNNMTLDRELALLCLRDLGPERVCLISVGRREELYQLHLSPRLLMSALRDPEAESWRRVLSELLDLRERAERDADALVKGARALRAFRGEDVGEDRR